MAQLVVGTDVDSAGAVTLSAQERSTHMHVIGSTGSGKSRFLISCIKQDIKAGQGLCLLDPHGELYTHLVEWLSNNPLLAKYRTIHLLDFSDPEHAVGFNPLANACPETIASTVEAVTKGVTIVYGGNDPTATPLIKASMDSVCHALIENNLTLIESEYLMHYEEHEVRHRLTNNLTNPQQRRVWQSLNARRSHEFDQLIESTERRLRDFLNAGIIRRIFGQRENTIDFKQVMDKGDIVLINCGLEGGIFPPGSQRLAGMLVINNLVSRAFERKSRPRPKPFHLYIDEAPRFLTHDIAQILVETRKFGLHVTLAHQNLSQLRVAGEEIYGGVMGEARTKVVFGGLSMGDARIMAGETLYGEVSPYKVNRVMDKPVVVGYKKTRLKNASTGTSVGTSNSETNTQTEGTTLSETLSQSLGKTAAKTIGKSRMRSRTIGSGQSDMKSLARSKGTSSSEASSTGLSESETSASVSSEHEAQSLSHMAMPEGVETGPEGVPISVSSTQGTGLVSSHASGSSSIATSSQGKANMESESEGHGQGRFESQALSEGEADIEAYTEGSIAVETKGQGISRERSQSVGQTRGTNESVSESEGYSESLEPILEWLPTQLVSTDDQFMELSKFLKDQPQRYGIIRSPTGKVSRIKSLYTPNEYTSPTAIENLKQTLRAQTPFVKSRQEAEAEITRRQAKILESDIDLDMKDGDFWE